MCLAYSFVTVFPFADKSPVSLLGVRISNQQSSGNFYGLLVASQHILDTTRCRKITSCRY